MWEENLKNFNRQVCAKADKEINKDTARLLGTPEYIVTYLHCGLEIELY